MNFFKRAAATSKEPPVDSTTRRDEEDAPDQGLNHDADPATATRERQRSARDRGERRAAVEGGSRFGKWLNPTTSGRHAPPLESSAASVRSNTTSSLKPNTRSKPPRSEPSPTVVVDRARSVVESSTSSSSISIRPFSPTLSPSLSPSTTTHSETKTLATRLQELAIANADGLLDADEYRILRHQVFEAHANRTQSQARVDTGMVKLSQGAVAVPRLENAVTTSRAREPSMRLNSFGDRSSTPTTPPLAYIETLASPIHSPPRAPSVAASHQSKRRSTLNPLNSFFRRESASSSDPDLASESHGPPRATSPILLARAFEPIIPSSGSSPGRRPSTLSPPSSPPPLRNRSIWNHPGMSSSAIDSRSSSSHFAPRSSRSSTGARNFAGGGGGSETSAGGRSHTLTAPRSPTSVRTSYYGTGSVRGGGRDANKRVVGYSSNHSHDRSSAVETMYSSSHLDDDDNDHRRRRLLPPIASSSDPFLFAATGREPTAAELGDEIREIEDEWTRMRDAWRELEENRVEAWRRQVGDDVARRVGDLARRERAERGRDANDGTEDENDRDARRPKTVRKGLFKRASILALPPPRSTVTNGASDASSSSGRALPRFLLSLATPLPADFEQTLSPHSVEPTLALRVAMDELADRRRRTEDKYERRLEFLRAKETGAKIKQGLLK